MEGIREIGISTHRVVENGRDSLEHGSHAQQGEEHEGK